MIQGRPVSACWCWVCREQSSIPWYFWSSWWARRNCSYHFCINSFAWERSALSGLIRENRESMFLEASGAVRREGGIFLRHRDCRCFIVTNMIPSYRPCRVGANCFNLTVFRRRLCRFRCDTFLLWKNTRWKQTQMFIEWRSCVWKSHQKYQ